MSGLDSALALVSAAVQPSAEALRSVPAYTQADPVQVSALIQALRSAAVSKRSAAKVSESAKVPAGQWVPVSVSPRASGMGLLSVRVLRMVPELPQRLHGYLESLRAVLPATEAVKRLP